MYDFKFENWNGVFTTITVIWCGEFCWNTVRIKYLLFCILPFRMSTKKKKKTPLEIQIFK